MKLTSVILLLAALPVGTVGGRTNPSSSATPSTTEKRAPDLVIEEVFFQERPDPDAPISPPPPKPGEPKRAICRSPQYQFMVLVSNQGDRTFSGEIAVEWEEMEWMTRPLRGRSEGDPKLTVLSPGEAVWITVTAHESVRDRSRILFRIDAIPAVGQPPERTENNGFEWQAERNDS